MTCGERMDVNMTNQIGVIGLGTMGKALAQNLLSRGFSVAGFNRSYQVTQSLETIENFSGYEKLEDFINSLEKPRKIILMVPAGDVVDEFIVQIVNQIETNDIIMDCGNSYYKDTVRRSKELAKIGIHYFGVGVSGGEKGALLGPSIMPGGDRAAYSQIEPYLTKIAAVKDGKPCCSYIGSDGSGHFVKMVHNGIEYADMQLIAEIYLLLKQVNKLDNKEISQVFNQFNTTEVKSFLVEITGKILAETDPETGKDMVDIIKDAAAQKGTGKWTIIESAHHNQNTSMIYGAVNARVMSSMEEIRQQLKSTETTNQTAIIDITELLSAYSLAKTVAYAQGFAEIKAASKIYDWQLDLGEIAAIFRAGCIIQAEFLNTLMKIYKDDSSLENIITYKTIRADIDSKITSLRQVVIAMTTAAIPAPTLTSALTYLDQLRADLVGANMIQAQRDFFGAHKFQRTDREGLVHHEWNDK